MITLSSSNFHLRRPSHIPLNNTNMMASEQQSVKSNDLYISAIHETGVQESEGTLTQSVDLTLNDSVFDSDIFHDQTWDNLNSHDFDAYSTSTSIPFVENDPATDGFSASLSSIEGFSDFLNAPPLADEHQIGVPSAAPFDWSHNSQTDFSIVGREMTVEPGREPTSTANIQQRPLHAAGSQRGLPRRRSRYLTSKSEGRAIPVYAPNATGLDPMQRWQESPPEDEPASITAIMNAMEETETPVSHSVGRKTGRKYANAFRHRRRPASTTSGESSASSTDSAWSSQSTSIRNRRSRGGVTKTKRNDGKPRIFCCTFCCDRFGSRYEWVRHEKSLHLNLETWYCAPLGPSVFSAVTGREHCAYCNALDPSKEHLSRHNYEACQNMSKELRSFRRKDHLVQHLRHVHQVHAIPLIDDWKVETKNITSRCGFCDMTLDNWDDRIEHLARHFRRGYTMKDWKGDHGFPPSIAAQLKNAYPPYLLGWESESIIPFSATNKDVRDHYAQVMNRAYAPDEDENAGPAASKSTSSDPTKSQLENFLDVFTRHLSQYARKQMELGVIPTDEMFQKESRRVLFDSEDGWDQTIADNPDWLSTFRRLHCGSANPADNIQH